MRAPSSRVSSHNIYALYYLYESCFWGGSALVQDNIVANFSTHQFYELFTSQWAVTAMCSSKITVGSLSQSSSAPTRKTPERKVAILCSHEGGIILDHGTYEAYMQVMRTQP